MSRTQFDALVTELTEFVAHKPLDAALADELNTRYGAHSEGFEKLVQSCKDGVKDGWMCTQAAGGIRYGRVVAPSASTHDLSVDVVDMDDVIGPHHAHPNGEIDLVMPIDKDARFDGHGAGWVVYAPGSAHKPTVRGGRALILYLLPQGAIQFSKAA